MEEGDLKHCFILFLWLVWSVFIGSSPCSAESLASSCNSTIYSDSKLSQKTDTVSIYETVFLHIVCGVLPIGSYTISTQWMDEEGTLQSERTHNFQVEFPRSHSVGFKFKQLPKGSLKRMLASDDFEDFQYGRWSVLAFLNNEEIGQSYFTITN